MNGKFDGVAEQMTSSNHLVRQLDNALDFSFIQNEVEGVCRPAVTHIITPEFIARYMLLIHLFDLDRPIRASVSIEINIDNQMKNNAAYRWFLKSDFGEPMPSYEMVMSTRQNLGNEEKWQLIFGRLIRQCTDKGLPHEKNGAWDNMDCWD